MSNATEALTFHLRNEASPPPPRSLEEIRADTMVWENEEENLIVAMVTPRTRQKHRVRINVTIDPDILERADRGAESEGHTRSGYFEAALRDRLHVH